MASRLSDRSAIGVNLLITLVTLILFVALRKGLVGVYVAQAIGLAVGTVLAAFVLSGWIAPRLVDLTRALQVLRYSLQ